MIYIPQNYTWESRCCSDTTGMPGNKQSSPHIQHLFRKDSEMQGCYKWPCLGTNCPYPQIHVHIAINSSFVGQWLLRKQSHLISMLIIWCLYSSKKTPHLERRVSRKKECAELAQLSAFQKEIQGQVQWLLPVIPAMWKGGIGWMIVVWG
jgi:hypothetical protein